MERYIIYKFPVISIMHKLKGQDEDVFFEI